MKNRLLSALVLLLNISVLSAQNGTMSIVLSGGSTCTCDGCFYITTNGIQMPYTLLWSSGMVSTITTNPASVCGFCPGQYSVTVTSNSAPTITVTASGVINYTNFTPVDIISLDPAPCNSDSAGVAHDCDLVCAGATVTYTTSPNLPISGGLTNWSVSGASSWEVGPPPGNTISVTWGNPGSGSIKIFTDGAQNCSGESFLCVTVLEPPSAKLASNPAAPANAPLQVCKGQVVDFQNLSTGDADYYEWFFSDDFSSSSEQDPQHTYLNAGTHTVVLIASSSCLCSDTTTMIVEVLDALAPTLDCVATICLGETVTYTASNACAPFSWTVSANGTILEGGTSTADSITVQWNNGPNGAITLGAAACSGATCPLDGVINIPIISDNAEIRGEERVCPSATEVYSIESFGGAGFVWTLSSGGNITDGQGTNRISIDWYDLPSMSTTHWLSVKYDNCYLGCGGQDSIPVKILAPFIINGPVEACVDATGAFTTKFSNNNAPILCNWALTDPNGNTVWSSASASATVSVPFTSGDGYYRLFANAAIPSETCSDQADWSINVRPLPAKLSAIKGELNICPGITYTYEAEGGSPQSNYFWTLQNGAGGPLFFPGRTLNVTWNAGGPRWLAVSQVSSDGLTCKSDTIQIQVSNIGIPVMTGTPLVCEDNKGSYSITALQNIDLLWQISPAIAGSIASGQGTNAVEIYWSQPGGHAVNLSVCGQTIVFPVVVAATPAPIVQAPVGLCPGATGLVQTTTAFSNYAWKNDAGTILSTTPTMMLGPGNYAVAVADANGCNGTEAFFIDLYNTPDVSLTTASPTGFCNNSLFVPLTALTTANADYTFEWFQDGVLIPGQTTVVYTTNQYGSYTVQATNSNGCSSVAGPIRLVEYCGGGGGGSLPSNGSACPAGTADLAIDATARCDSFQMHLLDPNGLVVAGSVEWIVGISGSIVLDSSKATDPSFTFDNAGEYVAILTVQLTTGLVCNVFDFFGAEAVARFDVVPGCPGIATNFTDASEFLPSGGIASWDWNFGDPASGVNNQSSVRNASHTYSPTGNYPVTLTVTGNSGCTSTASSIVEIPGLPNVTFPAPAFNCAGNALEFNPPPNAADITELSWDFGDPASGNANDATGSPAYHNFSPAGTYTVTATATNVYGCTASFSRSVVVAQNALSGIITPPAPPNICEGSSITLNAPAGGVSYVWSDDNATTTSFLTVSDEGSYRVTMTDANGCTYTPPAVNVEINPAPDVLLKALIFNELGQVIGNSYPSVAICEGEDVVLQAVTNGSTSYSWSVSNGNNPFLYFTDDRNSLLSVGNYNYSVTVTNPATGCTAVSDPFVVTVNPMPSGFWISGTSGCAGTPNVLTYMGPQPANWQLIWSTGVSGATTLNTEQPGVYRIRVINEFGCEARSNPWTVLPGPPVNSLPAGCHTRCNPDTLCVPVLPTVTSWQWFQNGVPIPGATTPDFIATQSGTYWAQLTDIFGCSAESDPLSLQLYDGYGNILGQVWSDVNNNGVIDASDTLVSGIPVILYQNGTIFDAANSGTLGDFAFPNILSTNYSVQIDPLSLPPNWTIIIGQDPVALSGCDVEGTADLLVHFGCQAFGTLPLTTCPGGTVTYQGSTIAVGGSQSFQYTSVQGCDSTLVVSVSALPTSTGAETLYSCQGSTVNYAGFDLLAGTTQQVTLQNWLGCDSIVTVNVQAWPNSTGSATLFFACTGGFALYNSVSIPAGTTQSFTLQTVHGCDSVVAVTVVALPPATGAATLFACPGGSATYAATGANIPVGTSQNFTLQTWLGCDSIVTVSVAEWPTSTGVEALFACPGGAASYAGTSVPVGTSQVFPLQNWLGCDSLVTVNVATWPTSTGAATLFACPGGAATYAGAAIPVGTSQVFPLQNWLGCDSMVTVNVLPWVTMGSSFEVGVCPGESFVYEGMTLTGGTVQPFILPNWLGCDSTVTVTVKQLQHTFNSITASVCPGETYEYGGRQIAGGDSEDFLLPNAEGCDSTVTVFVNEHPTATFAVQTERACTNAPTGSLEAIMDPGGQGPFQFSLNKIAYQTETYFGNLSAGDYQVFLEDANGCIFERDATIPAITPLEVLLPNGILPCDSTRVTLAPTIVGGDSASLTFKWWDGSSNTTSLAKDAGPIWVEVTDVCGTERSEAVVSWAELTPDLDIVYVPNVLKPSAVAAENAQFKPLFASGITLIGFKFMVFDRWGSKLFETQSTADGWDGIFGAQEMNPGVQVWYLEADVAICGRIIRVIKKGDVTVVR